MSPLLFVVSALVAAASSPAALPASADPPAKVRPRDFEARPELFVYLRPELRTNPSFSASAQDDAELAVQQSLRAGAFVRKGAVSARVVLQDVRAWGARASSTSIEPSAFAYQGYVEVDTGDGWLRVGRQEVHVLNGFYVSSAPWNPAGRSFDGVHWQQELGDVVVELAGLVLAEPFPASLPDSADDQAVPASSWGDGLGVLRATWTGLELVEPSLLVVAHYGDATVEDPSREKRWLAPGGRVLLRTEQTELDLNGLVQLGREGELPRRAHSVILHGKQALAGPVGLVLQFEQTSGHACGAGSAEGECAPSDVVRDFDLHFGRNHYLRGQADLTYGSNARQLGLGPSLQATPKLGLVVLPQLLQLTNPAGAWRSNGGALHGTGFLVGNTNPNVGVEVDVLGQWSNGAGIQIDGGFTLYQPIGAGAEMTEGGLQTYSFVRNRFAF